MRLVDRGIEALVSVFESHILLVNLVSVRCLSLALELDKCLRLRLNLGHGVLWVGLSDREEIVGIDDDASLLHDAVRALRAGLVDIPYHFLVNALQEKNNRLLTHLIRTVIHLRRGWLHQHWHAPGR